MNRLMTVLAVGTACTAFAVPQVGNVSLTQEAGGDVVVSYDLSGEDAIVTAEFEVDGKAVAPASAWRLYGDVCKVVASGTGKRIVWRPEGFLGGEAPSAANTKVTVKAWTDANPPPVMVQDMATPIEGANGTAYCAGRYGVNYYPSLEAVPGGIASRRYKTAKMPFVRIPAKGVTFWMGSPSTDPDHRSDEPYHQVTLTNDYYLAVYEMTQAQFLPIATVNGWNTGDKNRYCARCPGVLTNDTGSSYNCFSGKDWELCPVDCMTEYKLRDIYGDTKGSTALATVVGQFRAITCWKLAHLPTEAEWEYACRAGSGDPRNVEGTELDEIAWHQGNSDGRIHPVGLKKPNAWGLYDMLGNVWECCRDVWWRNSIGEAAETAPEHYSWGRSMVSRGGAFDSAAAQVRSASRHLGANRDDDNISIYNPGEGCRLMIPIFN